MMKVLTFLPRPDLRRRIAEVLSPAQFVQLTQFARYDGVLVDSDSLVFGDVLALVGQLRQESPGASLFVLARYLDLEQRLRLFEAGVDGYVSGPFFASEMAVRLRLSMRLRQAAASLAASNTVNVLRSGDLELDLLRRRVARPDTERKPPRHANHDPRACMEFVVRGLDQRCRCVHQRSAKQSRSRFSSEVDSNQPWHRLYPQVRERLFPNTKRPCRFTTPSWW
jgi:DNA-binding NarL/FixJ family response regulator